LISKELGVQEDEFVLGEPLPANNKASEMEKGIMDLKDLMAKINLRKGRDFDLPR
jgi:hypothetical protein